MSAPFVASEGEPALDEGVYPGRLDSIEEGGDGQFGPFNRWNFTVKKPDGTFTVIDAIASAQATPKTKAFKWATALLGRKPNPGEQLDLTGKLCQLHLSINENGFNKIEAVLPAAGTKATPVPFDQTVEVAGAKVAEPLPF